MKANPGGNLKAEAVLGRESEIREIWQKLETRSVVFTAERRIGKTCLLRKMVANPLDGWIPIMCWVESARHPIEVVEKLWRSAEEAGLRSGRKIWLRRFLTAYTTISRTELGSFRLPQIESSWKRLCESLFEDLANADIRVLVIIDEFPHFIDNLLQSDRGAETAKEFLDFMREVRHRLEPNQGIRLLLVGSVGLHLIVQKLKDLHGFKSNPTGDMAVETLSGMSESDTALMCRSYLEEEGIERQPVLGFDRRMFELTDGLPLYIQYVCEEFQSSGSASVTPNDIDNVLRDMLDRPEVEWFADSAVRIRTHYKEFKADGVALAILDHLCNETEFVSESDIRDFVLSQMTVEDDQLVLSTLDLLRKDHYVVRDTSGGERRYRFKFDLMRRWWKLNRDQDSA